MFGLPEPVGLTDSQKPSIVSGRQPMADSETVQFSSEGKVAMFLVCPFILIHNPIFFVPVSALMESCSRRQDRHHSSMDCVDCVV